MQKNLWKHLPTDFDRFMKSPRQNGNIVTSMNGKQQLRYEKKNEIRIFHSRFGFDLGWINSLQRSDLTQIDAWYPRNVKLEWLLWKPIRFEIISRTGKRCMYVPVPSVMSKCFWFIKTKVSNAICIQLFTTYHKENVLYSTSLYNSLC